jgi:hypothetical protein
MLQTYHPTEDASRGVHAFTTLDPFEALAIANALKLRAMVGELLNWQDLIAESVAQTHGEGSVALAIRDVLAKLDAIHKQAGGGQIGDNDTKQQFTNAARHP